MCVYALDVCSIHGGQKKVLDPWKWSYVWMVVSHHVSAGNWTRVLYKSSQLLTTELSLQMIFVLFVIIE